MPYNPLSDILAELEEQQRRELAALSIENMTRGLSPLGDMGKRHPLQASALRPNAATHSRSPFVS
jgi:hypothetical protein